MLGKHLLTYCMPSTLVWRESKIEVKDTGHAPEEPLTLPPSGRA